MVGLHVLDNEIVGRRRPEERLDVAEPLVNEILVDRVEHGYLLVEDDVRIVRHAAFDGVLAFKQVDVVVIDADITDVIGDLHKL